MGRAWVLRVPPAPAGPGPGPPFLCGVAPGQQGCRGQGGEVGFLSGVGFLGVSLFSKHFSVLFAACKIHQRGDVTPHGCRCPPCPGAMLRAAVRGGRQRGRARQDLPSATTPTAPGLGSSALHQAGCWTPTCSCLPHHLCLCPLGSADRGPVCVRVCVSL